MIVLPDHFHDVEPFFEAQMPSPISELRRLLAEADDSQIGMFDRYQSQEHQGRIAQAVDRASVDALLIAAEQTTEPIAQALLFTLASQHRLLNHVIWHAAPAGSAPNRAVLGADEISVVTTLSESIEHLSRTYYHCLTATQCQKPFHVVS